MRERMVHVLVVVFGFLVQVGVVVLVHKVPGKPFKRQAAALSQVRVWFMSLDELDDVFILQMFLLVILQEFPELPLSQTAVLVGLHPCTVSHYTGHCQGITDLPPLLVVFGQVIRTISGYYTCVIARRNVTLCFVQWNVLVIRFRCHGKLLKQILKVLSTA